MGNYPLIYVINVHKLFGNVNVAEEAIWRSADGALAQTPMGA